MSITLTERAAAHVKGSLEKRGKGVGIRLGVKTAGCSGLAYKIEFVDEAEGSDHAYDNYGVRVCRCQKLSLPERDNVRLR